VDIWDNSDQFHFAYKELSGAGTIIAKVESVENTHEWAKAGVMIRDTLDADSRHAMMVVTPAQGVSFQRRSLRRDSLNGFLAQCTVTNKLSIKKISQKPQHYLLLL